MVTLKSKPTALLLCIALLFIGIMYFPNNILSWDIFGYYLYLPMTFIYHDLGMRDFSVVDTIIAKYHNTGTFYQGSRMPSGDWVMLYGIGLSVLYSPFFFIGHLIAKLTGLPADGFSGPYQYSIWAGSMIYTFIGIFMLRKSLLRFFEESIVSILLIIITLGTNYTLHTSLHGQGAMTHNYLFTIYTFILWFTIRWHETYKMKYAILLASMCGLAALVRATEIVCILIPVFWGIYNKQTFFEKLHQLQRHKIQVLGFVICMTAIGFVQFTYWKIYAGKFIYNSYYNPGQGLDFPPHTLHSLFSFRNGWLIYTPVMLFALGGFYSLCKKNKTVFISVIIYFTLNLWIVSSWTLWWYAQCFGQRALIASYVMLSLPMGYLLQGLQLKQNIIKYTALSFITFFILLNLFQTWQVASGILPSNRATAKFWITIFGKITSSSEDQKFLYMEWPVNGTETCGDETLKNKTHSWKFDFEEANERIPEERLNKEVFHSGHRSYKLDSTIEFTPPIEKKYMEITEKYYACIRISVWIYPITDLKQNPANIVATFMHNGEAYKYGGVRTDKFNIEMNKWNRVTFDYFTPEAVRNENDNLRVYIWNNNKSSFFIDDLEIEVLEPKNDPSSF